MTTVTVEHAVIPGLHTTSIPESEWEELDACLICGNKDVPVLMRVEGGAILSICVPCRFGFLRRRPTAGWFDKFYASEWDAQGQQNTPTQVKPNIRAFNAVGDMLDKKSTVLDVGAGFGSMLIPFKEAGHSVIAIEPSEHRRQRLGQDGIPSFELGIEDIWVNDDNRFDLIIMHHVLEHLHDPLAVLKHVKRLLRPNGLAYIALPSFIQEHPYQAVHFVPHLSLFTFQALTKAVDKVGLAYRAGKHGLDMELLVSKGDKLSVQLEGIPPQKFYDTSLEWALRDMHDVDQTHIWTTTSTAKERYPKFVAHRHIPLDKPLESMFEKPIPANLRALWTHVEHKNGLPLVFQHKTPDKAVWVK